MAKLFITALCIVTFNMLQSVAVPEDNKPECGTNIAESICTTSQCIHSASSIIKNMNNEVDPCENFYDFACGNYAKQQIIPDEKSFVAGFTLINDHVRRQIMHMLEEPVKENESRPFVMAKNLYQICYDTKAIDENGIAPVQNLLTPLGGWPLIEGSKWKENNFDWKTTVYTIEKEGFSVVNLLPLFVTQNAMNSSQYIIKIGQGMLELDRKSLLEGLDNEVVKAYYDYIVEVAVLMGANKNVALTELREVVNFEMEVAKITLPDEELRNLSLNENQMTIKELQERYTYFPWLEYINHAINKGNVEVTIDDIVSVDVPSYLTNLYPLLNRTSNRVLHNHLLLHVVTDAVPYLSKKFKEASHRFAEVTTGTKAMKPRWMECVDTVNLVMPMATSALYVRKYFTESAKQTAEQLVRDLRDTFNDVLNDIDWMDKETKSKALEKENAMRYFVAYPPELLVDKNIEEYYAELNFSSNNYLEAILNANRFLEHRAESRLKKPVDKNDWTENSNAVNVNAYYMVADNSILIPAGILQGVFFNNDRPHYMNYGSIGFVIGHELTHGFDDVGRQFDKNGELSEWWGEETKKLFVERAQCFIDQYSNFTAPRVKLNLNGIRTQGENIADNGGIKKAYFAYEKWIKRNGEEPRLPGLNYTPKQMFWISAANLWCMKQRDAHLRQQILTNEHSPARFRVLGSFSNSDQFAKDFNCPVGSKMNPVKKCKIW